MKYFIGAVTSGLLARILAVRFFFDYSGIRSISSSPCGMNAPAPLGGYSLFLKLSYFFLSLKMSSSIFFSLYLNLPRDFSIWL
jgi:hypothetical protein